MSHIETINLQAEISFSVTEIAVILLEEYMLRP